MVKPKILIFIVTYNAESHVASVLDRIPAEIWSHEHYITEILMIDDASADRTKQICDIYKETQEKFNLKVLRNSVNQGYGGNQKIGYLYAIKNNYDIVVLLHGDGQYAPECLCSMIDPIASGDYDFVIGSRMINKFDALRGGMPLYKFTGNRILTFLQNRIIGANLSEFHSGYRAYSVKALKTIPFQCNSNDFDFDTDIIIQMLDNKYRIKEIPIPTFYGHEICYVNGFKYAWNIIKNSIISRFQCINIIYEPKFDYSHGNFMYEAKVDFPSSHSYALAEVEDKSVVLDLGSGPGHVAQKLKNAGCEIHGIDLCALPPESTAYSSFAIHDLNRPLADLKFKFERLDAILAMDIIEHLDSPENFLTDIRDNFSVYSPKVILTTGNTAFISERLSLLFGFFNYGKKGILDLTHKRLFTMNSLKRTLRMTGYKIKKIEGIPVPFQLIFGKGWISDTLSTINKILIFFSKSLFSYQIAVTAIPAPTVDNLLDEAMKSEVLCSES